MDGKFISKIKNSKFFSSDVRLRRTCPLEKFENENIRDILTFLYESDERLHNLLGSVLNSVFFEKKRTFAFSRRLLYQLLERDANISINTVHPTIYKRFLAFLNKDGIVDILRKQGKGRDGKALILKIKDAELCEILTQSLSEDYFKEQEGYILSWYDGNDEDKDIKILAKEDFLKKRKLLEGKKAEQQFQYHTTLKRLQTINKTKESVNE